MADNSDLAGMLGEGTRQFQEYLRRSGRGLSQGAGQAVDWLAGGAKSGADPVLGLMRGDAMGQPLLPTADSGGRLGAVASALTGPMMPIMAPKGALGAGPVMRTAETGLDMSPEARAARAQEMGYTVDAYHGTKGNFDSFSPDKVGSNAMNYGEGAYYFTDNPNVASGYAMADLPGAPGGAYEQMVSNQADLAKLADNPRINALPESIRETARRAMADTLKKNIAGTSERYQKALEGAPQVIPSKLRFDNPYIVDADGGQHWNFTPQAIKAAQEGGHDGAIIRNVRDQPHIGKDVTVPSTVYVPFNPNQIRSRNAAFDPAKANSPDLLASRAPLPAAPQTEEQKRAAIAELLRNGGT
jgi:hypothetical protein